MRFSLTSIVYATSTLFIFTSAAPLDTRATQKAYFLLVGDSTTAPVQTGAGGWGDGFANGCINTDVASVYNAGVPGASTGSYISSGKWDDAVKLCKNYSKAGFKVFMTIQFGHNDENQNVGTSTYSTNLKKMLGDVAGCSTPIVVTPLSRRFFRSDGTISDSLQPYRNAALSVAKSATVHSIDLWQSSITYLQKIGPTSAHKLDLTSGDSTHINSKGSNVFGRMVADLIYNEVSGSNVYIHSDKALSKQIADGTPTY